MITRFVWMVDGVPGWWDACSSLTEIARPRGRSMGKRECLPAAHAIMVSFI
jgi:hypothetical protein